VALVRRSQVALFYCSVPTPLKGQRTVKPGEYSWLGDGQMQKIYATKFTYRVTTPGQVSFWICTSAGPDVNGYFKVVFTQENLRTHLGVTAARVPPPQAGPTQEQVGRAVTKIIIAAVAHNVAKQRAQQADPSLVDLLAEGFAKGVRDGAIQSSLRDPFPQLSQRQASDVQFLISEILDGQLEYGNLDQQATKRRLKKLLGERVAADLEALETQMKEKVDRRRGQLAGVGNHLQVPPLDDSRLEKFEADRDHRTVIELLSGMATTWQKETGRLAPWLE
jgi:hypothetical protein